jgi:bacterioferritin-associated ferredoxin
MIVCLCRGLSDHAIRARLATEGVGGARRLVDGCGAGTDCGSCAWMLEALLALGESRCEAMSGS